MVSFEVESLFTNVPLDDAVQAALRRLESDSCLADRTTLTPTQIADPLGFVWDPPISSTTDQFMNKMVQPWEAQSPQLSQTPTRRIVNHRLHHPPAPCTPNTWECYVDDTFTILNRDNVDNFLQHFNSQQPTIRFKMETKIDNTIPCHFLTHWSHRIQTDDSPIVFIDSPRTLINTLPCLRTIHTAPSLGKTRYW